MNLEKPIKEFLPVLREAQRDNLNESDTRMRIRLFLERVLGYDMLKDMSAEYQVSGHYVDLAIKLRNEVKFLVEVKQVSTRLRNTHVYQAVNYAAQTGVRLVALTNGIEWRLYNVSMEDGRINNDLVFTFNLLEDPMKHLNEKVSLLSKSGVKKGIINKYVDEVTSLSDRNLLCAMMTPKVLNAIRSELKKVTGTRLSEEAVAKSIRRLFSEELWKMVKDKLVMPVDKKNKEKEDHPPH